MHTTYLAMLPTIPKPIMPAVTFCGGTLELERLPATHPELGLANFGGCGGWHRAAFEAHCRVVPIA